MTPPPTESPRRGRHYTVESAAEAERQARHSVAAEGDPGHRPPTLATPAQPQSQPSETIPPASPPPDRSDLPAARHRDAEEDEESAGQHIGGQPVSELMARLQVGSTGGGRRRRRED
jgi:hypothetical protein